MTNNERSYCLIASAIVYFLLNCLVVYEFYLCICQVIGVLESNHACFAMTGSFANPGPLGGMMAMSLVMLVTFVWKNRDVKVWHIRTVVILSIVSSILCFIVLPASMSRAAWLAVGIALAVFGFKELELKKWIKGHKIKSVLLLLLMFVLVAGAFSLKKDSAIGRLHIWHMELRAIIDEPWSGYGRGTALGVYGDTQAEYFLEKPRSPIIVKVAGSPEFPFNEYFKIGIEYGIFVMFGVILFLISFIMILLKSRSPFAYGLIVLGVFAFFSYPLDAIGIKSDAERSWESVRHLLSLGLYEDAVIALEPLYENLKDNDDYLYDYGFALYKCGKSDASIDVLMQGTSISANPMFYNIIGKNYEAQEAYDKAEASYLHAYYMVPHRIYPLTLLMRLHVRQGNDAEALRYGRKILNSPINDKHERMCRLYYETKHCVDSLMLQD